MLEGVFVYTKHVTLDGFVNQTTKGFQPDADGILRQVTFVAHPFLPPLYEVVAQLADAQPWVELLQRALQRAVTVLGDATATGRQDDATDPLADGGRARQVVLVCIGNMPRRRSHTGIKHFVLQLHQLPDDATDAAVQQVVVGMGGLDAPTSKVVSPNMDMRVNNTATALLVEFDDHLALSVAIDIAITVQAYIVVYCYYHGVF